MTVGDQTVEFFKYIFFYSSINILHTPFTILHTNTTFIPHFSSILHTNTTLKLLKKCPAMETPAAAAPAGGAPSGST